MSEKRASGYLQRCLAGEEVCYCYYLDIPDGNRMLLECRMLPHYGADDYCDHAILIVRDLTRGVVDPLRSAEENRV